MEHIEEQLNTRHKKRLKTDFNHTGTFQGIFTKEIQKFNEDLKILFFQIFQMVSLVPGKLFLAISEMSFFNIRIN